MSIQMHSTFSGSNLLLLIILLCNVCLSASSAGNDLIRRVPIYDSSNHIILDRRRRLLESTKDSSIFSAKQRRSDYFDIATELYQGYGAHYIILHIGNPPQRQTVLVDTGSSATAFPCNECLDCGQKYHMDANFNETLSGTFQQLSCSDCLKGTCDSEKRCDLHLAYAEGSSWRATEVSDVIYFGGFRNKTIKNDNSQISARHNEKTEEYEFRGAEESKAMIKFGCQREIYGQFKTQLADGILGLSNSKQAFWTQLLSQNKMSSAKFSLCYSKHPVAHFDGSSAGSLIFGGSDIRLHSAPMVFAEFTNKTEFYEVHIRNIYLLPGGGESLTRENASINLLTMTAKKFNVPERVLNKGGSIIDSGTTGVYFNSEIKEEFNRIWKELMGFDFAKSNFPVNGESLRTWPTIFIQLKGSSVIVGDEFDIENPRNSGNKAAALDPHHPQDVLIALPPSHYMEYSLRNKTYFSRLVFADMHHSGTILGAALMQGHDFLFDIENNRIGIAESTCDYNYLITGKHMEEFDPYNFYGDIKRFYNKQFCSSEKCQSSAILAFWISNAVLAVLFFALSIYRIRNRSLASDHVCIIKLKMSEEVEYLVQQQA